MSVAMLLYGGTWYSIGLPQRVTTAVLHLLHSFVRLSEIFGPGPAELVTQGPGLRAFAVLASIAEVEIRSAATDP